MARKAKSDKAKKPKRYKCPECDDYMVRCDVHGRPREDGDHLVCPAALKELEQRKGLDVIQDGRHGRRHELFTVEPIWKRNAGERKKRLDAAKAQQAPIFDDPNAGKRPNDAVKGGK